MPRGDAYLISFTLVRQPHQLSEQLAKVAG